LYHCRTFADDLLEAVVVGAYRCRIAGYEDRNNLVKVVFVVFNDVGCGLVKMVRALK